MRRRQGFTIVELLVALALIIFIMAIVSEAFVNAMKSFRDFKAAGDMAVRLRSVMTQLRRDLTADHFTGKRRVSDPNFWQQGPPEDGFLRLWQRSPSILEGRDRDGLPSYRSTSAILHMMVRQRGNDRDDFFSATVPLGSPLLDPVRLGPSAARYQDTFSANTGSYNSRAAEVVFFLRPAVDANGVQDTANGTPLYSLYRHALVTVPDNNLVQPPVTTNPNQIYDPAGNYLYSEVSATVNPTNSNQMYFNSPRDLTMPARRVGMDPANPAGYPFNDTYELYGARNANLQAADLLLTDVVSFDMRVLVAGGVEFEDLFQLTDPQRPGGVYFPTSNSSFGGTGPRVFDTWSKFKDDAYDYTTWATPGSQASVPILKDNNNNFIRLKAIQITLRVWDLKTQTTRQVSIVQDL
jgi:type II secretory pathway pseudopilin PulG